MRFFSSKSSKWQYVLMCVLFTLSVFGGGGCGGGSNYSSNPTSNPSDPGDGDDGGEDTPALEFDYGDEIAISLEFNGSNELVFEYQPLDNETEAEVTVAAASRLTAANPGHFVFIRGHGYLVEAPGFTRTLRVDGDALIFDARSADGQTRATITIDTEEKTFEAEFYENGAPKEDASFDGEGGFSHNDEPIELEPGNGDDGDDDSGNGDGDDDNDNPDPNPSNPDPDDPNPGPGDDDDNPDPTPTPPSDDDDNGGGGGDSTIVVTGVNLSPNSLSLVVGGHSTLTASVTPSNATNQQISWSTSNANAATVSGGTVTAVAAGTATITATSHNGQTATCNVTVSVPTYAINIITPTNGTVVADPTEAAANATVTLMATPSSGYGVANLKVVDSAQTKITTTLTNTTDDGVATYTFTMPAKAVTVMAEFAEVISYLAYDANKQSWSTQKTSKYVMMTNTPVTQDINIGDGNYYVITGAVTANAKLTVVGTANLILRDESSLTLNGGVMLTGDGNVLNVFAQSTSEKMGVITASGANLDAVIGGADEGAPDGGTLRIHGGKITVTPDASTSHYGVSVASAAIYGGELEVKGGKTDSSINGDAVCVESLVMSGGILTAQGADESSGARGIRAESIILNGGTLTATASGQEAAIYVTDVDDAGTLVINGGTLTAKGGVHHEGIDADIFVLNDCEQVTVTGGDGTYQGSGMYVDTFTMKGGKLTAQGGTSSSYYGGHGIEVSDTFVMEAGELEATGGASKTNNASGAGISVRNSFTMKDGTLKATGGAGDCGGAGIMVGDFDDDVYSLDNIDDEAGGTFSMEKGTLRATGGASSMMGGIGILTGSDCTLRDVELTATGGEGTEGGEGHIGLLVGGKFSLSAGAVKINSGKGNGSRDAAVMRNGSITGGQLETTGQSGSKGLYCEESLSISDTASVTATGGSSINNGGAGVEVGDTISVRAQGILKATGGYGAADSNGGNGLETDKLEVSGGKVYGTGGGSSDTNKGTGISANKYTLGTGLALYGGSSDTDMNVISDPLSVTLPQYMKVDVATPQK